MVAAFKDAARSIGQKSLWLMIESNKIEEYMPIGRMMQLKIVVMVQICSNQSMHVHSHHQHNPSKLTTRRQKLQSRGSKDSDFSMVNSSTSCFRFTQESPIYPIDKRFYRRDSWFGLMSSSLSSWSSVPSWRCSSSSISFLTRSAILVKVLSRVMGVSGTKSCSQQQDTFQISTSWISDFQDKRTGLLVGLCFSMSKALVCQLKHFLWNEVKAPSTWYLYF